MTLSHVELTPEDLATPPELAELVESLAVPDDLEPAPFPDVDEQDSLDELGGPGDAPRTSKEAAREGRRWIAMAVFLGVGYCLRAIRSLWGVMPLWPDATTGWEEAEHRHPETDPMKIPWGVPVWWVNDRHGHVAFSIGGGWCLTTDFKRSGFFCVARIAALGPWCGGRLVGWTNDINGVVVWRPKKAKPEPVKIGGPDEKLKVVEAALRRAKEHNAETAAQQRRKKARVEFLSRWRDRLRLKVKEQEEKR